MAAFRHLIRFKDRTGRVLYGEGDTADRAADIIGKQVKVLQGESPWDPKLHATGEQATVDELLCPLPATPIIYGVGVNYRQHLEESKVATAKTPRSHPQSTRCYSSNPQASLSLSARFQLLTVWISDALAGPLEDIPIDKEAKSLDYEGELCVIIGESCKNLFETQQDPLDFVLGYAVGNDVSARHWQSPQLSGGQHGYAKAFDKFAPVGPAIVSTSVIPDPSSLKLTTMVNGGIRQQTGTDDLLFDVKAIIRHMSRGRTIRPGTVIMTGTPSGVGFFMEPSGLLKDGDVVEVEIDRIGSISNKMVFES